MTRSLYDCTSVPLTPAGPEVRLVIATHPGTSSDPAVGVERDGIVYELFVSTLPALALTASDVLDLYLHRGSFETTLADEDEEQQMDRWYSHAPCGQEFAQILAQWMWNLRLELGHQLSPADLCTTEFAPAHEPETPSTGDSEPVESTCACGHVRPTPMGSVLFYAWFPWFCVYSPARWDAALPCQSSTLSPGAASRTRWLSADLVCCARRPLPLVSVACQMSRKQHHAETTTGERSIVAALHFSLGFLAS
jgi:hypothetical protein